MRQEQKKADDDGWLLPAQIYTTGTSRGYLLVCEKTFYSWVRKGVLPKPTKIDGKNWFHTNDIDTAMIAKARGIKHGI